MSLNSYRRRLRSETLMRQIVAICARRGFRGRAPVCGRGRRVSEDPRTSRDRRRGSDAYEDFLTRWKDADADVPILVQAKAEYARLQ